MNRHEKTIIGYVVAKEEVNLLDMLKGVFQPYNPTTLLRLMKSLETQGMLSSRWEGKGRPWTRLQVWRLTDKGREEYLKSL